MTSIKLIGVIGDVPVYSTGEFSFIKIKDLPIRQQDVFIHWLYGQTLPYFEEFMAAYSWDYERFILGLPIID